MKTKGSCISSTHVSQVGKIADRLRSRPHSTLGLGIFLIVLAVVWVFTGLPMIAIPTGAGVVFGPLIILLFPVVFVVAGLIWLAKDRRIARALLDVAALHAFVIGLLILSVSSHTKWRDWLPPLGILFLPTVTIAAGNVLIVMHKNVGRGMLSSIIIDERGIRGTMLGGEKINISWNEVLEVKTSKRYVQVITAKRELKITARFIHFPRIVNFVRKACKEKGIKCFSS